MAQEYARIFVRGHYLFREANSFPRVKLEENGELRETDNVQGQISEHIFAPNEGYCLYYPSNFFRSGRSFENWGIFLYIDKLSHTPRILILGSPWWREVTSAVTLTMTTSLNDVFQCHFFEGGASFKKLRPKMLDESLTFLFFQNVLQGPKEGVLQSRVSLMAGKYLRFSFSRYTPKKWSLTTKFYLSNSVTYCWLYWLPIADVYLGDRK